MKNTIKMMTRLQRTAMAAVVIVAVVVVAVVARCVGRGVKETHVEVVSDKKIDITPEQIKAIKAIGQWEFLSVSDEEIVDTLRKGIFTDDHLVRIYYGTLRIGIDMHKVKPGWITVSGDSVRVTLPKVGLLDEDFIDETRTKSFYESGRWSASDREAMYRRAYAKMRKACLTPSNITSAADNADAQMRNMLGSMGFRHIIIRFEK